MVPCLKVHNEGEKVHINDPVYLYHASTGLHLHVDLRPRVRLADGRHEASGMLKPTALRMQLYRSYSDHAQAEDLLLGVRAPPAARTAPRAPPPPHRAPGGARRGARSR